ncbi:MAG: serine/threonine-protein phosphatase, partial [Tissierellales bacterium]
IKDHSLKYANAGHNCVPIKYNSHSIEFLNMKGLPISLIFNEIFYEESEIILSKGDKILFFTDGIVEVKDRNKNQFGVDRIIDIIKAGDYDILDKIIGEVEKFRWGEQIDDYALLLMEVLN